MNADEKKGKERPILFSGEMVRAILEGRKTQTRRVIKPQPHAIIKDWPYVDDPHEVVDEQKGRIKKVFSDDNMNRFVRPLKCPYGQPGDRLWVRETFMVKDGKSGKPCLFYKANGPADFYPGELAYFAATWQPSIHMPRGYSRINLKITGVRVERVQGISYADALAEGVWRPGPDADPDQVDREYDAIDQYIRVWNEINTKRGYGWESNPYVWVIELKRI